MICVGVRGFEACRQLGEVFGLAKCCCDARSKLLYGEGFIATNVEYLVVRTFDSGRVGHGWDDVAHVGEGTRLGTIAKQGHWLIGEQLAHEDAGHITVWIGQVLEFAIHVVRAEDDVVEAKLIVRGFQVQLYRILGDAVRIGRLWRVGFAHGRIDVAVHGNAAGEYVALYLVVHRSSDEGGAAYQVILVIGVADVRAEAFGRVGCEVVYVLELILGKEAIHQVNI